MIVERLRQYYFWTCLCNRLQADHMTRRNCKIQMRLQVVRRMSPYWCSRYAQIDSYLNTINLMALLDIPHPNIRPVRLYMYKKA